MVPLWRSCRFTLCIMNALALLILQLHRVNVSLTMVCMVYKSTPFEESNTTAATTTISSSLHDNASISIYGDNTTADYRYLMENATSATRYKAEFTWTRSFQGHVLSSYFYGYLSTMFLGGLLSGRYGGKYVLGTGLMVSSVANILIPPAVRFNKYLFIVLRIIVGAASGLFLPPVYSLSGLWYCPFEYSSFMAIIRAGQTIGSIVAFLLSAHLCDVPIDNGWPLSFYLTGGLGVICWFFWLGFVYNSPEKHPRITDAEKQYISRNIGVKTTPRKRRKFPFAKAITSPAVWAIVAAHTTNNWFLYLASTSISLYIRDVLSFDIKQNGLLLMLPYVLVLVTNVPAGYVADVLQRKRILSAVVIRKIFQSFASFGSAVLLLALAFMDHERRHVAVGLLIAIIPVLYCCRSGFSVNALDIAPRYSGEIYGISNTFATLSGIVAPIVVGCLTTNGSQQEWRQVFYIASGILAFGGLVFMALARGTTLPWADADKDAPTDIATVSDGCPPKTAKGGDVSVDDARNQFMELTIKNDCETDRLKIDDADVLNQNWKL